MGDCHDHADEFPDAIFVTPTPGDAGVRDTLAVQTKIVGVEGKHDSSSFQGPRKLLWVGTPPPPDLVKRHDIDAAVTKALDNCAGDVLVDDETNWVSHAAVRSRAQESRA
jgi:hypothetical protein